MRQLWIVIIAIYLCVWVSGQGSGLSVEKRPDNGQMQIQSRPNRNKRPHKQSPPAQNKQPAQQIPHQRDPKPVNWDGRRVDYVGQCTNAYLKEFQMANHHPSAPVFCADCIRFNGRIKRNSCIDLNYCLGYDKTQGVLIRQWDGGAFRRGGCYGCTLIPEPFDMAVRRHDVQCTCRTKTPNPVTGAYVAKSTFPIGHLVNEDGDITCFPPRKAGY
ncbi:hypothetical protein BDV27DRAFT_150627 [Aspergillus caelatus]|uniref:Cyanovirin-N domain-containing protein n=1 Tax=Aspergillus caelatus TaxID=61420 RepID=A0A5N6ZLH5_9EURO|nr:uncharacterized protein BDV27DRAFT_150627 [Aspergillus caelatus]KAE8358238.1 hypothetical protein BDV27DRAFT_150627 [Aspergillus caelatus]